MFFDNMMFKFDIPNGAEKVSQTLKMPIVFSFTLCKKLKSRNDKTYLCCVDYSDNYTI